MTTSPVPTDTFGKRGTDQEDETEPLDAAIYARTSSSTQRFGYSISEQISRCGQQCESADWTVRYVFRDEAESGRDTERPQFQLLLQKAGAEQFDVVVFWALDRFCRSLVDLVKTEEKLSEWGVALHSVTEFIDTTSPVGRFNFRNLASAAELESDLTSKRARMGMYGLAKDHRWPNKTAPLGYDKRDDDTLSVNDEEAALVRRIFHLYLRERSMPSVAFQLNENGHRTKAGEQWSRQSVKHVLSNELYTGQYEVAGFEDDVEEYQFLSEQLFETVTEARYRFKASKQRMGEDRKSTKARRILDAYQASTGEEE
jgi:site-specific DNA recombinase